MESLCDGFRSYELMRMACMRQAICIVSNNLAADFALSTFHRWTLEMIGLSERLGFERPADPCQPFPKCGHMGSFEGQGGLILSPLSMCGATLRVTTLKPQAYKACALTFELG